MMFSVKKQLLFDGIMSALLRKDLFRVPMRPISGTDEDRAPPPMRNYLSTDQQEVAENY